MEEKCKKIILSAYSWNFEVINFIFINRKIVFFFSQKKWYKIISRNNSHLLISHFCRKEKCCVWNGCVCIHVLFYRAFKVRMCFIILARVILLLVIRKFKDRVKISSYKILVEKNSSILGYHNECHKYTVMNQFKKN